MTEEIAPAQNNDQFVLYVYKLAALLDIEIDDEKPIRKVIFEKAISGFEGQAGELAESLNEVVVSLLEDGLLPSDNATIELEQLRRLLPKLRVLNNDCDPRIYSASVILQTKLIRARIQSDPFCGKIDEKLGELTRYALSRLGDVQAASIQKFEVLHLLECAACATPASSLGVLHLIQNYSEEIKEFDYVPMLTSFNKAIAFQHSGQRKKALKEIHIILREDDALASEKVKSIANDVYLKYITIPASYFFADTLNKMQLCYNANNELKRQLSGLGDIGQHSDEFVINSIKGKLLQASCWLEIGSRRRVTDSVAEISSLGVPFIHENILSYIGLISDESFWEHFDDINNNECFDLSDNVKLNMTVYKFCINCFLDKFSSRIRGSGGKITDIELKYVKNILDKYSENYIERIKNDRYERHNFKELLIDVLGDLEKVKKINNSKDLINNVLWRAVVQKVLNLLNKGPIDTLIEGEGSGDEYSREGHIANEIWGDSYKILHDTVYPTLWKVLENLVDDCEKSLHNCLADNSCQKEFLKNLVEFERCSLGLNSQFNFPTRNRSKLIYPQNGSYLHRKIFRRGQVIKKYRDQALETCPGDSNACFTSNTQSLLWINANEDQPTISDCLKNFFVGWEGANKAKIKPKTLINCALHVTDYKNIINDSDYQLRLKHKNSKHPIDMLENKLTGVQFVGLRRWNSHTPEISFSYGGGYFLFVPEKLEENEHDGNSFSKIRLGIAIDPGFDFIHNFFSQGFTLNDIDIILITHADSDHINDFRGLADLLRVSRATKRIYNFMTFNSYDLLKRYIYDDSYRNLYHDTVIVSHLDGSGNEIKGNKYSLLQQDSNGLHFHDTDFENGIKVEITPVPASHDDHVNGLGDSCGYVIKIIIKDKQDNGGGPAPVEEYTIGYTGDSQWVPEYQSNFEECDFICSHMGSVMGDKTNDYDLSNTTLGHMEALIRKKNHPYLPGKILFLEQIRRQDKSKQEGITRLLALSEFGEEMKGAMRIDICKRINRTLSFNRSNASCWESFSYNRIKSEYPVSERPGNYCTTCKARCSSLKVIPADIGLRVSLKDKKTRIHCVICDNFHEEWDIDWVTYGSEEAIFYVCGPCKRGKTTDVLNNHFKSIIENGRTLRLER